MAGEALHATVLGRRVAHDAALGAEPEHALVFHDAGHVLARHVEPDACEAALLVVKIAQAVGGAHPQAPALVGVGAVHLVVGQRVAVALVVAVLRQLAGLRVAVPQAPALGREPEALRDAFDRFCPRCLRRHCLVDVDGEGVDLSDAGEAPVGVVVEVQVLHRGHPGAPLAVVADGVAAGAVERAVAAVGHVVGESPRWQAEHVDAGGVGAYPQVVALQCQGVHVQSRQLLVLGVAEQLAVGRLVAHETAVVAGYPHMAVAVLAEAGYDVARQPRLGRTALEAAARGGHVVGAAIERAGPQAALSVGGDGIDEAVGQPSLLHEAVPLPVLGVEAEGAVVATDADAVGRALKKGVYVQAYAGGSRRQHLL